MDALQRDVEFADETCSDCGNPLAIDGVCEVCDDDLYDPLGDDDDDDDNDFEDDDEGGEA